MSRRLLFLIPLLMFTFTFKPAVRAEEGKVVVITAAWKAKKGKEAELEEKLRAMVKEVKAKEPKCLQYTLQQGLADKSVFFLYEKYADNAAANQHMRTVHFVKLVLTTRPLIAESVDVKKYFVLAE